MNKQSAAKNRKSAHGGLALAEYGIIAACVMVASLAAIALLGKNLAHTWGAFGDSLAPRSAQPSQIGILSSTDGKPASITASASQGDGTFRQVTLTLSNGAQISIPQYPTDSPKSILTLGANGTSEKLLAALEHLTKELKAKGKITEEQASALRDLANRGHEMAEREKFIEDYLKRNNRPQQGEPVIYKGKTYDDLGEFAQTFDIFTQGDKSKTQADFDKAYQEVLKSSSLQDPAIRTVIDNLVQEISNVADMFGEGTFMFVKHPDRYPTYDSLLEYSASKLTHENSAGICREGDRNDSGVQCQ